MAFEIEREKEREVAKGKVFEVWFSTLVFSIKSLKKLFKKVLNFIKKNHETTNIPE